MEEIIEKVKNVTNALTLRKEDKKENKKASFFKNNYTNVAKGLAVLLLLFHHLGLNPELNLFESTSFLYLSASECKVCVAIFVLLSGYGLNASFNKKCDGKLSKSIIFILKHLLKLMTNFWIIFILFVGFGSITGLRSLGVYGEGNILKLLLIDFLGLASVFESATYNATWWFMSLIIILYLLFPILKFILKRAPIALGIFAIFVKEVNFFTFYQELNTYLVAFCMGMIFSELCLFDKIRNTNKTKVDEIIVTLLFLLFAVYFRYKLGGIFDLVAAFAYVFLCNNILMRIKGANKVLELLGKHSSNIFMFHTFIYKYFFNAYFAKLKYWILMYIALIISTLVISIIIEETKKLCKKLYSKVNNKIMTYAKG